MGAFLGGAGKAVGGLFNFFGAQGNLHAAQAAQRNYDTRAGIYGSEGSQAFGEAMPMLRRWTNAPPGYGALGLASMRTNALQAVGAQRGAALERARLAGAHTGNIAAVPGMEAGIAEQASRAGTTALNDIAARNAELQQQQQRAGLSGLEGIYGTAGRLGLGYQDLSQKALQDQLNARSAMWGSLAGVAGGAAGVFGKSPSASVVSGTDYAYPSGGWNPGP
jgi:hypothetical protein